jgi:hypothetical protein
VGAEAHRADHRLTVGEQNHNKNSDTGINGANRRAGRRRE